MTGTKRQSSTKPESIEAEMRRIIQAVAFHSAEAFSFLGRPSSEWMNNYGMQPNMPPFAAYGAQQVPGGNMNPLVRTLQWVLYAHCYSRPFHGAINDNLPTVSGEDAQWVEMLAAANATRERWEDGWQVQQFMPSGQVVAQRRGVSRAFWPGEFLSRAGHGMAPQPGTPIAVFFPRDSKNMQPGFYFIFGHTTSNQQDEASVVRYYWNIRKEGGESLVRNLTTTLNRYQVPFRFKIVNHPELLNRSDAAILYVGRHYYRIAAELSHEVHETVENHLDDSVPLFSKRLAKGLGFAEDPGNQESFGMSRCRLLAEGLLNAFVEGKQHIGERLDRVKSHFAASGTSLEKAYLNFAAVDPYEFPL